MTDRKLNTREEADARYKWAIEDLYKDDEDWKRDYELLKSRIPELTKFRGRLGESAEVLLSMQTLSPAHRTGTAFGGYGRGSRKPEGYFLYV